MKNKTPSPSRITIINIISSIIIQGLAFISGPIFSALLGPNNYGIATVYLTWVTLASTIFTLQAGGTIALARVNFPIEDQNQYQSSVLSLSTFSYICFSALTIIVVLPLSNWWNIDLRMVVIGLAHGWGLYCVRFLNSKFTYEFKADRNLILSITTSLLIIGASVLFIFLLPDDYNYWGRILGQASVYFLLGSGIFVYILKNGGILYNKDYWKFTLPIAVPTIFHLLANTVLNQSDRVMLQAMVDNSATGIYALACTFGSVLGTIWGAFNSSWVPFYYEYTRNGEIAEMRRHATNYMELFTIISMGFVLLAREVFHVYAAKSFWPGTDLIPVFALGHYCIFMYSFPVNYEFYNKKTKMIASGTTFAAVFNIILNYVLIRLLGILGAVLATAISCGLQFVFHYICAKNINPGEFPFKLIDFLPGFLAVALTCVFYYCTRNFWYLRWPVGAILGIYLMIKIIKRKEIF